MLIQFLKENAIVKTGKLIVRKAGGADPLPYYEIDFTNLRVTSFRTHTEDMALIETVTLAFETAKFKYIPQSVDRRQGRRHGGVHGLCLCARQVIPPMSEVDSP